MSEDEGQKENQQEKESDEYPKADQQSIVFIAEALRKKKEKEKSQEKRE